MANGRGENAIDASKERPSTIQPAHRSFQRRSMLTPCPLSLDTEKEIREGEKVRERKRIDISFRNKEKRYDMNIKDEVISMRLYDRLVIPRILFIGN